MFSRLLPMEELAQRSVMYWLPHGGKDNGVFATMWVVIAELEARDAAPVLTRMADVDIGAYASKPSPSGGRTLYVDVMQYNQALDVLMVFLRGKEPAVVPRPVRRASTTIDNAESGKRRSAVRIVRKTVEVVFWAALFVGLIALVYFIGSARFPTTQPLPPQPASVLLAP